MSLKHSKQLRVLFTSAGRRVELLQCFRRAADALGLGLDVLACDLDASLSAACNMADHAFNVPRCSDPSYIDAVLDITRSQDVSLVIPTIDPELRPLAIASDRFAAIGARVHVSPPGVIDIAQDKVRTAEVLSAAGIPVPLTFALDDIRASLPDMQWPLFMKPKAGSASRGVRVIRSVDELPQSTNEPMLLQELLVGPEYTVNIFIDRSGSLQCSTPHRRLQVRAGEVEKGRTERREDLKRISYQIAGALPDARGALCYQVIDEEKSGPKVFEINARFGGGYPLADRAGAKFAQWLLEEIAGIASSARDDWQENITMLRYDAAVFKT